MGADTNGVCGSCGSSDGEAVRARLRELVRSLLREAATQDDSPALQQRQCDPQQQVIVDLDVDGHRFLLVRMPPAERNVLHLSPREWEIVRMVAQGHPSKIIALVLNISSWTVGTHVRRVFAKLGVSSRAAMVARLLELNGAETMKRAFGTPPPTRGEPAREAESGSLDRKSSDSTAGNRRSNTGGDVRRRAEGRSSEPSTVRERLKSTATAS